MLMLASPLSPLNWVVYICVRVCTWGGSEVRANPLIDDRLKLLKLCGSPLRHTACWSHCHLTECCFSLSWLSDSLAIIPITDI